MDFRLSEQQRMMVASVRALAEKEFKPHLVEWDQARGFPRKEVARKLREWAEYGVFNTFFGEFNFAQLPEENLMRSIRLFGEKVMPALRAAAN